MRCSILIFSAYELYLDPQSDKPSTSVTQVGMPQTKQATTSAERFKRAFSYKNVQVHFVGAWYVIRTLLLSNSGTHDKRFRDTVSSIGIARGQKMLPGTVDGMKHVCFFRHALALDERRVKFSPEYAYGGSADKNPSSVDQEPSEQGNNPSTKNESETTKDISPSDEVDHLEGVNKVTVKHPQTLEVWFAGTHSDM